MTTTSTMNTIDLRESATYFHRMDGAVFGPIIVSVKVDGDGQILTPIPGSNGCFLSARLGEHGLWRAVQDAPKVDPGRSRSMRAQALRQFVSLAQAVPSAGTVPGIRGDLIEATDAMVDAILGWDLHAR